MSLAGYIVASAILLGCGVVCALKGKFRFVALGLFIQVFWIVGAIRPAKQGSAWAVRFGAPEPSATAKSTAREFARSVQDSLARTVRLEGLPLLGKANTTLLGSFVMTVGVE